MSRLTYMEWSLPKGSDVKRQCEFGINEIVAKEIVKSLEATDFSKYFDDTTQWGCDLWAFGKDVDDKEIYIKIGLGRPNRSTVCVSFHKPDHPIQYQFK